MNTAPASASASALTAPAAEDEQFNQRFMRIFDELYEDDDWDGLSKLESTVTPVANAGGWNEHQSEAYQVLGHTYLEQYYSDGSLVGAPPETREEVMLKAKFCSETALVFLQRTTGTGRDTGIFFDLAQSVYLDLAQELYFLGRTEKAQVALKKYLDEAVKVGPSHCQTCHENCSKDGIRKLCEGCHVTRYCSKGHQKQVWKKGHLCHKVMCPLLKRWRWMQKGKDPGDSYDAIFNDFFAVTRSDCQQFQ